MVSESASNFIRPVPVSCPITRQFGDIGPYFPQHYDEVSKRWSLGRFCQECQNVEPCGCPKESYVGNHCGVDYGCPEGTPILAIADGIILLIGEERRKLSEHKSGYIIVQQLTIEGFEGWKVTYRHVSIPLVRSGGERVYKGDRIGYSGYAGAASPYVHIELQDINKDWQPIPLPEIRCDIFKCRTYHPENP